MADNDISRNYALNIEVNVDSKSLEELKKIQSSTQLNTIQNKSNIKSNGDSLSDADRALEEFNQLNEILKNSSSQQVRAEQTVSRDVTELSSNISKLSSDVQQLMSELKSKNEHNQNQFVNNASNLAFGDISRSVTLEIMKAVNDAVKPIVDKKIKTSYMSGTKDTSNNSTGEAPIDSKKIASDIEKTTGKRISVVETAMGNGQYGAYDHDTHTMKINEQKPRAVRMLAAEHESTHVVQEARGYTRNNLLFQANAKTSEAKRNASEYANEYITNTIALIRNTLSGNIDKSRISEVVKAYNDAISGKSGVVIKNIEAFTGLIKRISGLSVAPETFISNIGQELSSLHRGNETYLSSAAKSAGYRTNKDGIITDKNGKPVSDKMLLELRSQDGKRINMMDIYSHQMAHLIKSSSSTLKGIDIIGRNNFIKNAANEFSSMSDFGVGVVPINILRKMEYDRSKGTSWKDILMKIRELTETTHRGAPLYTNEEVITRGSTLQTRLKNPGNVLYNGRTPLEKIMFSIAGKNGLDMARLEPHSGRDFSKQDILNYLKQYIFAGTGTDENKFLMSAYGHAREGSIMTKLGENYSTLIGNVGTQLDMLFDSDILKLPNTFIGTNAMNSRLGDLAFYVRAIKRGVRTGNASYMREGLQRLSIEQSPEVVNDEGQNMSLIDNVSEGHMIAEQTSQQELADIRDFEKKRIAYENAKKELHKIRRQIRSGDTSEKMISMSDALGAGLVTSDNFKIGNLSQLDDVEKMLDRAYASIQRQNPEIVMKEKIDALKEALRKILFILHPNEDMRKMQGTHIIDEARAVIEKINAIPDNALRYAEKNNRFIDIAGVSVGAKDLIEIKNAVKDYEDTRNIIHNEERFRVSQMSSEGKDALEVYRTSLKDAEEEIRKKAKIPKLKWKGQVRESHLKKDKNYSEMLKTYNELLNYYETSKKSEATIETSKEEATKESNKKLLNPTTYTRKVNGEEVERGLKFDKNEAAIISSIYENASGAYNLVSGHLDSLSVQTQAKKDILKKIRKNLSYMDFVNSDGSIKDFAGPLFGSLSDDAQNRMIQLEGPMRRIIELSGNISGNAPKRVSSMKELLSKYLHRGYFGPELQLQSQDEFVNHFISMLHSNRAKNISVDSEKMSELFKLINEFNIKSEMIRKGVRGIKTTPPINDSLKQKDEANEAASRDIHEYNRNVTSRTANRVLDKDNIFANLGMGIIKGAGIKLTPTDYRVDTKKQYKIISGESTKEGDYASGASVGDKDRLEGIADYLLRKHKNTSLFPYQISYKDNLSHVKYDLGDLKGYTAQQKEAIIKAAQAYGFRSNPEASLVSVRYSVGKKTMSPETTARDNNAIDTIEELDIRQGSKLGDRRYSMWLRDRNASVMANANNTNTFSVNSDIAREFSNNIRTLVERALNGGASSSVINKISNDVSSIKSILSSTHVHISKDNTENIGNTGNTGKFKESHMSSDDLSEESELYRRASIQNESELSDLGKNNRHSNSVYTNNKKVERAEFEADLASKTSKKDKLSLIDERLSMIMKDAESAANEEDKARIMQEYHRLRRKRIETENGPGTKQDRIEFSEWKSEQRMHNKEFIASLSGKNINDISSLVANEIKRLLNLSEIKSVGAYDKKAEISKIVTKLKEFEQSQILRNNKNSIDSAILELKRRYKGEDNAFDATLKGLSVDTRVEKLRKEVERLNDLLKELKRNKEDALASGNERLASFYSTLEFQRETRKSVVEGKLNRAVLVENKEKEAAQERAKLESQKFIRDTQKEHGRMISLHDKEGSQARNIFSKGIEYSAMATMVYSISREIKNAIDVMSKFERQMVEVTRVMDPLYQSQENLSGSAKVLADKYGVSIIEVAKGMAVFAQQGKNAMQVVQLTEASLLAANTTTMNAAQATEALTSAIRQFNLSDSDANKVIDAWLEVESRTAIQAGTMADAIKISGTAAKMAGLSFHEFNGILSAVGSATRETGTQLGTAFKFIISKMNTEDVVNALQKIGVATHNQNGDMIDLMQRLSDVNSKWKDMTSAQRASLAITIAGTRRYNTFMTLMERWDEALDAVSMSEDSHGKAMKMNAMIMDTYEKRVQKAKASVESFYSSMSKSTTKGFLGNIQKMIEMLAKFGEKSSTVGSLLQVGLIAGGFGLFHRLGGSMGISTALEDIGIRDKANSQVTDYFNRERATYFGANPNSWVARNFAIGNDTSRRLYMDRLNSLYPEMQFNETTGRNENHNEESDRVIKRLTEEAFPRLRGKENTEAYVVAKDKIRAQYERELIRQSEYTSALNESSIKMRGFGARVKAVTEYLGKHAVALQGFGIALQSISNIKALSDKNSITGKNVYGEAIDLAGTAGSAVSTGLLTSKMLRGVKGGGKIGVAIAVLSALPKIIELYESWKEKIFGSDRLSMQRLQKEGDRLKTVNTSISTYQRLRKKELNGEVLSGIELSQKESAADMIAMSSYGSVKDGHRGLGHGIDEKEVDRLAGLKEQFTKDRNKYDEELSFKAIFAGDATQRIRTNLWRAQEKREKLSKELSEFDSSHTGPLSKKDMDKRAEIFSNYTSAQEEVQKHQQELTQAIEPYFLLIEKSGKRLSDRIRRGDSTVESVGTSEKSRQMYDELLKSYNGNQTELRRAIARRLIGSNYQRGQVENSESAISNYQNTGKLHMLRKVGDKGNKSTIILRTYDEYGSGYSDQKFELDKAGNASAYLEQISKLTGISKEALMYTGDLSDALFRYNLKEIEKFSEISRKIGEVINNSFKEQMDRVNSISKMSTKYSFVGVEKQYKGFDKQLSDYDKASKEYVKGIGTFNEDIVSEIIKNVNSQNPSEAISNAARISSKISGERNLLGIGYSAMNNLVISSHKSSMASQIMDAIMNNKVKRGTDTDIDGIGQENSARINEYLKESGLGFESVEALQSKLAGKSEEEIKKFLSERVLAAAEMYAKKDAESVSKALKAFERSLDDASEKLKSMNKVLESGRQRDFAISISNNGNGGIIDDSDIIKSYSNMAGKEAPMDAVVKAQKQSLKVIESTFKVLSNTLKKAESDRDRIYKETEGKNDSSSVLRREMADKNVERASQRVSDVETQLSINTQKVKELERLLEEQKAMSTKSYGEFKTFMRNLESQSIKSFNFSDMNFGVGSDQFDRIKIIDKQNSELNRKLSEFTSRLDILKGKDKLTAEEKREQTELKIKIGEIEARLGENGRILQSANENLLRIHAEAIRRTRQLRVEHFANVLSRSKDTGRTQRELFNQDYKNTKDIFNSLVANYGSMTDSQKNLLASLGRKMEDLRDIGDLAGNPSFNKQYILASAQDRAIVDQIMQRRESGETMKQIFSDAGMKELGRSNPLVSQLMDNLVQKEQNERLLDTNNNMLAIQEKLLSLVFKIAEEKDDRVLEVNAQRAKERLKERRKPIPGFASGTRLTGSGGKFESAGLIEVHKKEGVAVLSSEAMNMYPDEAKRLLKAASDMNEGRFRGFARGTRSQDIPAVLNTYPQITADTGRSTSSNNPRQAAKTVFARDVFNYGGRSDILGLDANERLMQYTPDRRLRALADIMRVDADNMWMPASGQSASSKVGGFNQGGRIFINGGSPYSTAVHEVIHGAHGSQFGAYSTSREAMSILGEMAIGGSKNPGYGNFFTQQAYSGLKLGSNPAKNAQAIFDTLTKNRNYKYQWEGINSGLRSLDSRYKISELGTAEGNRDFKHAYAQAASVIAEYGRKTGTSSQRDIDKMFSSLERLLKTATGTSTVGFSATSKTKEIDVKTFAEACSEFRRSIDKSEKVLSNDNVMASIEGYAEKINARRQSPRGSISERISSEEFNSRYKDLRDYRRENYFKKYGITIRDGRAYSIYNPLERIRQSRAADFIRAGGLNYVKENAVDFAYEGARKAKAFSINAYRNVSRAGRDFYNERIKPGIGMSIEKINPVINSVKDFGKFSYDKLLSGTVSDVVDVYHGARNFANDKKVAAKMAARDAGAILLRGYRKTSNRIVSGAKNVKTLASNFVDYMRPSNIEARLSSNVKTNRDNLRADLYNRGLARRNLNNFIENYKPSDELTRYENYNGKDSKKLRIKERDRLRIEEEFNLGRTKRNDLYDIASGYAKDSLSKYNRSKALYEFLSPKRNAEALSRMWDGTVGSTIRGGTRLYNGTVDFGRDVISGAQNMYRSVRRELTPEALMNRRARILSQGNTSGVPGFGPKLTVGQRFKAEALRQAANFIESPRNYIMNPINKIGDMRVPFTTARALNYAAKKSGVPLTADLVNSNTARPMTVKEFASSIAENYRENRERRKVEREQRAQENARIRAQREADRQARQQAKERRDFAARYDSARSGTGLRSWFRDNFTEAGLARRQKILNDRLRSSEAMYSNATAKFTGAKSALSNVDKQIMESYDVGYLEPGFSADNGLLNKRAAIEKQVSEKASRQEFYRKLKARDAENVYKNSPSINRRLNAIRTVKKVFSPISKGVNKATSGIRNVAGAAKRGVGNLSGTAMQLKMLESAYLSGRKTINNIAAGKMWEATESGLDTIGSLHYSGKLDKVPGLRSLSGVAPAAFYASGALQLARGIKDKKNDAIASGTSGIANAALYSKPMQNILGRQVERRFGPGSVARFGKGMGYGMAANLAGTGIEMLGDYYGKPWLKRTGQVVGGIGEAVSDISLTASTMGLNKVVEGGIEAGRMIFDKKYRDDYVDKRQYTGATSMALEQAIKLTPGASGLLRAAGVDVSGALDEINAIYANEHAERKRESGLQKNKINTYAALLSNDKLKFGANATRDDKSAATFAAFSAIKKSTNAAALGSFRGNKKAINSISGIGPNAEQAAMEAYFRDEDASQMMKRYDVEGKRKASVRAQSEIEKLNSRLDELDKEDADLSNNINPKVKKFAKASVFGLPGLVHAAVSEVLDKKQDDDNGYKKRVEERNRIRKRIAELKKAGSFDVKEQFENTREAAQEYFDKSFGRKVNLFDKGGILEGIRKKNRDEALAKSESDLRDLNGSLKTEREKLFNANKLNYGYSSLSELEEKAKDGDEKAQRELEKFNKEAANNDNIKRINNNISSKKKEVDKLRNQKIDGKGPITEREFGQLKEFIAQNLELQEKRKDKELDNLKGQKSKIESDIKIMEENGSSKEAIEKKKEELKKVEDSIKKAENDKKDINVKKRVNDRLKLGEIEDRLANPKKIDANAVRQELASRMGVEASAVSDEDVKNEVKRREDAAAEQKLKDEKEAEALRGKGVKALKDPRKFAAEAAALDEKRNVARKVFDDPDKIRALNAGKKVKVKVGGLDVEVDRNTLQSWRGIKDEEISAKAKAAQEASKNVSEAISEETVRQELADKKKVDVSKVTDEDVKAEVENRKKKAAKKEAERKAEEEKRKREAHPLGRVEARKKALEEAENAQAYNAKKISELSDDTYVSNRIKELKDKESDGTLTDEQKKELNMLSSDELREKEIKRRKERGGILSRTILSRKKALGEASRDLMRNVRKRKRYEGTDDDVVDYNKKRAKNQEREQLERRRLGDGVKDLKDDEKGDLTDEQWKRLQELRKSKDKDVKAEEYAKKAVDAKTKKDEKVAKEARESATINEEEDKQRSRMRAEKKAMAFKRMGLRWVPKDDSELPTSDQRTEALNGEQEKATADEFQKPSKPRTVGESNKQDASNNEDANAQDVKDISKDTSSIDKKIEKVDAALLAILDAINRGGGISNMPSRPPAEGDKISSNG